MYRLVDDIEGNSFRLENNKGESLQLNLLDGLQFGEQITIPKAIKANERKHMKINTSRHKNEDNVRQYRDGYRINYKAIAEKTGVEFIPGEWKVREN